MGVMTGVSGDCPTPYELDEAACLLNNGNDLLRQRGGLVVECHLIVTQCLKYKRKEADDD